MQVHIDRNGSRYGPYNIEDINAYLANGALLPTDLAWHEGLNGWVPLANIQGVGNGTSAMMPQAVGVASQEQQNNQWGMFIHLSCALPGIGWITSIVLWKIKVQELPGTDVHGKNSANWIISIIIYWAVFHGVIHTNHNFRSCDDFGVINSTANGLGGDWNNFASHRRNKSEQW